MAAFREQHASAFEKPHPAEPVIKSRNFHNHHHENNHEEHHDHDINIDINLHPRPESEDDIKQDEDNKTTFTPAFVGGIAFTCAFAVFMLMSIAIVCINQSHKQAMTAISLANLR